jgi:hypothetical protein
VRPVLATKKPPQHARLVPPVLLSSADDILELGVDVAVAAQALRMHRSESQASSSLPRSAKLLGVSGMDAAPTLTMTAGTMLVPSKSGSGGETATT